MGLCYKLMNVVLEKVWFWKYSILELVNLGLENFRGRVLKIVIILKKMIFYKIGEFLFCL